MQPDSLVPPVPFTFGEMQTAPPAVRAKLYNVVRSTAADIADLRSNETRLEYWHQVASYALRNHDEVRGRIEGGEQARAAAVEG